MQLVTFKTVKSYATVERAIKVAEAKFGDSDLRYFIHRDEATGRYFPVFLGEAAVQAGVHFDFHVVA